MSYWPGKITWEDVREAIKEADRIALAERAYMQARLKEARKDFLIPLSEGEDGV